MYLVDGGFMRAVVRSVKWRINILPAANLSKLVQSNPGGFVASPKTAAQQPYNL